VDGSVLLAILLVVILSAMIGKGNLGVQTKVVAAGEVGEVNE
jgi:hypothetical protein